MGSSASAINADGLRLKSFSNGNFYQGSFDEARRSGKGRFVYANGDFYEGLFENGKLTLILYYFVPVYLSLIFLSDILYESFLQENT
jgi:hypothetical protein